MVETFEAVLFGFSQGSWSIIERRPMSEMPAAFEWARKRVAAVSLAGGYQRTRARVISSADEQTGEAVLRELRARAEAAAMASTRRKR